MIILGVIVKKKTLTATITIHECYIYVNFSLTRSAKGGRKQYRRIPAWHSVTYGSTREKPRLSPSLNPAFPLPLSPPAAQSPRRFPEHRRDARKLRLHAGQSR